MSITISRRDIIEQTNKMIGHIQDGAPRRALIVACAVLRDLSSQTAQLERQIRANANESRVLARQVDTLVTSSEQFVRWFRQSERALLRNAGFDPAIADFIIDEMAQVLHEISPPPNLTSSLESWDRLRDTVCGIVNGPRHQSVGRVPAVPGESGSVTPARSDTSIDLRRRKWRKMAAQAAIATAGPVIMIVNQAADDPNIREVSTWVGNVLAEKMIGDVIDATMNRL